jgi:hypothetical protein
VGERGYNELKDYRSVEPQMVGAKGHLVGDLGTKSQS